MPKSDLREKVKQWKILNIRFLLNFINIVLESHNLTVNKARTNGIWIDWKYDEITDTYKRKNFK